MKKQFLLIISIFSLGFSIAQAQPAQKNVPQEARIINGGVINGKALELPKPEYPAAARAVRADGAVNVKVVIDEAGNVVSASAVSGHPLLRQAAEQSARQARFNPTTLSGQPVKVTGVVVYNFILPKTETANAEKLLAMGLACYLTIAEIMPDEEWESPNKKDLRDAPLIAAELEPLTTITKATSKEARLKIVKNVIAALENKFTGADAWQFEFGKEFGGLMIDLKRDSAKEGITIDETIVKTRLIRLRDLLLTAPQDFPSDVLNKFNELVKFADVPNLSAEENKNRFDELILETLNTISPDEAK